MNPTNILLFDIDGVLVEPFGYRQAVHSALKYFFPQPQLAPLLPKPDDLQHFEASGIISEWDMVAMSAFFILDELLHDDPQLPVPDSISELASQQLPNPPSVISYSQRISAIQPFLNNNSEPSGSLHQQLQQNPALQSKFSTRLVDTSLLDFLQHTRDLRKCITTRIFQVFCLGDELFEQTYQIPADMKSPSLLSVYDQPNLSQAESSQVVKLMELGLLHAAVMTARPSRHPFSKPANDLSFSPEAEQAVELVHLNRLPIIGLGALKVAAEWGALEPTALQKPHPYHAIAALLTALNLPMDEALKIALKIIRTGVVSGPVHMLHNSNIILFEDSSAGIHALKSVESLLAQNGIQVHTYILGVAAHPQKSLSLERSGASVYENASQALKAALTILNLAGVDQQTAG